MRRERSKRGRERHRREPSISAARLPRGRRSLTGRRAFRLAVLAQRPARGRRSPREGAKRSRRNAPPPPAATARRPRPEGARVERSLPREPSIHAARMPRGRHFLTGRRAFRLALLAGRPEKVRRHPSPREGAERSRRHSPPPPAATARRPEPGADRGASSSAREPSHPAARMLRGRRFLTGRRAFRFAVREGLRAWPARRALPRRPAAPRRPETPAPQEATARRPEPEAGRGARSAQMSPSRYAFFFASSASISCGTTVNKSPTTPKSAIPKIGASASLLIATIVFAVCMPALC